MCIRDSFIWWFQQSCHLSFWYYIILLWKDWVNISNSWIGISDNTWEALIFWGFDFRWNPNSNTVKLANYDSPFKSPQGGLRIIKCVFHNCFQFVCEKYFITLSFSRLAWLVSAGHLGKFERTGGIKLKTRQLLNYLLYCILSSAFDHFFIISSNASKLSKNSKYDQVWSKINNKNDGTRHLKCLTDMNMSMMDAK